MLNGVPGFVRGDAERSDRRRVVNVRRKAKRFLRRIVMVAEEIIRFDDLRRHESAPPAKFPAPLPRR